MGIDIPTYYFFTFGGDSMEVVHILSADPYGFTDDKTGRRNEGVTVWYQTNYRDSSGDYLGYKPIKVPATKEVFESLKGHSLRAGLYRVVFQSRPGAESKPTLTMVRVLEFVEEVDPFASVSV